MCAFVQECMLTLVLICLVQFLVLDVSFALVCDVVAFQGSLWMQVRVNVLMLLLCDNFCHSDVLLLTTIPAVYTCPVTQTPIRQLELSPQSKVVMLLSCRNRLCVITSATLLHTSHTCFNLYVAFSVHTAVVCLYSFALSRPLQSQVTHKLRCWW